MSISLQHTPEQYDFCDNPIAFRLLSSTYLVNTGTKARQRIQLTGTTQAGDKILFEFLDYSLEFNFRASPDNSGLELTAGGTVYTLASELSNNYYLYRYFQISVEGTDKVELLALEEGSDYTIDLTINSSALSACDVFSGVDPSYLDNFKIYIGLFVENDFASGTFQKIVESFLDPNSAGRADYYFGQIIKRLFPVFEAPNFAYDELHGVYSPILKYYIQYAEYYGEEPAVKKLSTGDLFYCINGHLPVDKWKDHDFINDIKTNKLLLTNLPLESELWKQAHAYVYYLNTEGKTESFTVTYESVNTDGSSNAAFDLTIEDIPAGSVFGIPLGPDILEIGNSAKELSRFTIQVKTTDEEDPVTEFYTFHVIPRPFNPVNILYKNEYGVLDTLLCENLQLSVKTEKSESEAFLPYNYSLLQGNKLGHIKKSTLTMKASTGFIHQDEAARLSAILESDYGFMVGKTRYLKIVILPGSFKLIDQADDLQQFEFSFQLATSGTISTEELAL